jgi:hypothetical protein
MGPVFAVAGTALVLFLLFDIIRTTLTPGGGPLALRLATAVWKAALRLAPGGERRHGFLVAAGAVGLLLIISTWVLLTWIGWTLILCGDEVGVVYQENQQPATIMERFYYVGFVMVTLTLEDYEAGRDVYKVLTVLATTNGFFLITLAIAYLLPLVQAGTEKRQLGVFVSSLGESGEEIVLRGWDGRDCCGLESHLVSVGPMINLLTERHLTYPVLHYVHAPKRLSASAPSLAALDEALTLLQYGLASECRPHRTVIESCRRVLTFYVSTLRASHIAATAEPPPPPDLGPLRRAGLPVTDDDSWYESVAGLAERRSLFLGLVRAEGWSWQEDVAWRQDAESEDERERRVVEQRARDATEAHAAGDAPRDRHPDEDDSTS